ncbi:MAG: hypothetical protein ACRDSE_23140 [Pseudonocardiaceae bacterium]
MDALVIVEFAAVGVLLAVTLRLSPRRGPRGARRRAGRDLSTAGEAELDSAIAHAETTANWAAGSRRDWDRHIRPLLAREFDALIGGRRSGSSLPRETGEWLFGAELWPLVDPAARFTDHLDRPGPGRRSLAAILDRLEAA